MRQTERACGKRCGEKYALVVCIFIACAIGSMIFRCYLHCFSLYTVIIKLFRVSAAQCVCILGFFVLSVAFVIIVDILTTIKCVSFPRCVCMCANKQKPIVCGCSRNSFNVN